jgi:hypothetical protein
MENELESEDQTTEEQQLDIAARPAGDGMPIGNEMTPGIQPAQVTPAADGVSSPAFDDNAALTIAWRDYQEALAWLESTAFLAEWQYVDYLYQSPNFDLDWRTAGNRAARISRFNIAKNRNTMSNQVRRGIFADTNPFLLEPRGKLAENPNAQTIINAWTEIFNVLSERADFEYNMTLFIECLCLQGTAIANPGWETKDVIRKTRKREIPPVTVAMPLQSKEVNTWESDKFKVVEEKVTESWPFFEYRRLGTTIFDKKWRTPNRPDLSAGYKVDVDFVTLEDLQQLRKLDCYKDIPSDENLIKFFLQNPDGDAESGSTIADQNSSSVMKAENENVQSSENPFLKPLKKISYWTKDRVIEFLIYESRRKVIRNGPHPIHDHALGYTGNWWNIDNCGYGIGIGRLNAGDQRMDQGVLNEVLKMIAFPMNAPILYDATAGNAPTQNVVMGMGTFWGIQNPPGGDINKAFGFMKMPQIPAEAWKIYELGKSGGEDLVGANATTMQGNLEGRGSSAMRTAAGVNRVGSKADENVSDPIAHIEGVITRWLMFLWEMVLEEMPISEIRQILSDKFGEAILKEIDPETLLNAKFNIKILAGQKLAAKANIMQLVPFLLQLVQQPQLMQFLHEKGWTINFKAIEDLFMQMSELQGRDDIFIPLTAQEKQQVAAMNPNAMKAQIAAMLEHLKGQNRLQEIQAKGALDLQHTVVDKSLEHVSGSVPLELAEARTARNEDMGILKNGFDQ